MKRIDELKNEFEAAKAAAQALINDKKTEEAKAKMQEVKDLKAAIEIQEVLDAEEMEAAKAAAQKPIMEEGKQMDTAKNASALRAIIKASMGKRLTEAENALLTPATGNGTNGEGYLLPQDISTVIREKVRQYKSMRDVLGYIPTTALSGSFPVEGFDTLTGLVDFTDGTEGTEPTDVKFTNVAFKLKEKGAILSLSNTLLQMTDNDLIAYIAGVFAKKAIVTENELAFAALKTSKVAKELTDWKSLKKSINVDLDEGVKYGCVIVTNQDGFNLLDEALDETGRPVLQPNPTNPTQKMFMGYPIHVFSNAALKTETNKIPFFYGNLEEGAKFVDNNAYSFASSEHAGFTKNTTLARVIEYVDVVQVDASDLVYCYGEVTVV